MIEQGENGFTKAVIKVSHIAKELWLLGAAFLAVMLAFFHFDTKIQLAEALRERDREERLEQKERQTQIAAVEKQLSDRIDALEASSRRCELDLSEIRQKQIEVRRVLQLEKR